MERLCNVNWNQGDNWLIIQGEWDRTTTHVRILTSLVDDYCLCCGK